MAKQTTNQKPKEIDLDLLEEVTKKLTAQVDVIRSLEKDVPNTKRGFTVQIYSSVNDYVMVDHISPDDYERIRDLCHQSAKAELVRLQKQLEQTLK